MTYSTTTGTDYNPTGTNAEPNHYEYCWYRLPCGICTRTNEFCPLGGGEIKIDFNKVTCDNSDWYVSLDDYTKCDATSRTQSKDDVWRVDLDGQRFSSFSDKVESALKEV